MMWRWVALLLMVGVPSVSLAQLPGVEAFTVVDGEGGQTYSVTFQILVIMTLLALLPAGLMMVTSFARIVIVLAILRNAIGVGNTPSNQILVGLALFLTLFVMMPVFNEVYDTALQPYLSEELAPDDALRNAVEPFRAFMLSQTREQDIALFLNLADLQVEGPEDVPLRVLVPAFMTSELKTAFQIGFIIFLPFLIVDLVVASTLMSMGMLMLSPMIISMPFKIMLFVVVDGWSLIMGTLAASFFA